MAIAKNLTEDDIKYISLNTHLTASELSRQLDKPRPKISKVLKQLLGTSLTTNKTSLSVSQQKYILENYSSMTVEQMELEIGPLGRSSVSRFLIKNDIKRTSGPKAFSGNKEQALSYIKDNHTELSIQELADDLGTTYKVVSYWKNQLGLEPYACVKTSIESFIENILKGLEVKYTSQFSLNKYRYDFYLPDYNLVIETHGDYWHGNPRVYSIEKLNDVQIKSQSTDFKKKELLLVKGISLLVVWEKDIKQNPNTVVNVLREKLNMPLIEEIRFEKPI